MTGTELARAVHDIRPDVPIVLMTGYAGPLEAEHVRIAGVREIIRKPLLSGAIARCLARHISDSVAVP
jgi:CheY-like chemotaxis protein